MTTSPTAGDGDSPGKDRAMNNSSTTRLPCRALALSALGILALFVLAADVQSQSSAESAQSSAESEAVLRRNGSRGVRCHDPSTIVKCKDEYWTFITGANTPSLRSKDLINWTRGPRAKETPPDWVTREVPLNRRSNFWAPDVIHVGDKYLLFYSVSSFGKNTSAIGMATNATLDPEDPAYKWQDGGIVVQTKQGDDFNAIDPAAFLDKDGKLWMSFGSFWSGIKLIELDPKTGLRIAPDSKPHSLAYAKEIEAPYIYLHDGKYYLFVSHGRCCRGVNSTYHTRVGRADKVTGPYLDRDGKNLMDAGGTLVVDTEKPFIGPGHAGILEENGKFWFSCHFYDGNDRGQSKLSIRPLTWTADGWPEVGSVD
jgi:arabinan endo-1,5-alpha-L-arabinosidase